MAPPPRLVNPYEEQQTVLLARIVGNVVRSFHWLQHVLRVLTTPLLLAFGGSQERLNEAMLEVTKSLGVRFASTSLR